MSRNQAEFRMQCAIADQLRWRAKLGLYWTAIPNGEKRSAITGARLKRMGVRAGNPDLLLVWKGRAIGIELKAPGGRKPTDSQEAAGEDWTLAGGLYHVCRGYQAAMDLLDVLEVLEPDRSLIRFSEAAE